MNLLVTLDSLEEYVSLVVNATLKSGIGEQIEAFMSGINEVLLLRPLECSMRRWSAYYVANRILGLQKNLRITSSLSMAMKRTVHP